jgi:hypothetical protein
MAYSVYKTINHLDKYVVKYSVLFSNAEKATELLEKTNVCIHCLFVICSMCSGI